MNKQKINIVIPAAGLATRLRPLTNNVSKAMVSVAGRPTIDWIISDNIKKLEDRLGEIIVVAGENQDIKKYVESKYYDLDIKVVKQENPTGPLDAIMIGYDSLKRKSNPLLVWLGDTLNSDDLVIEHITQYPNISFVGVSTDIEDQSEWCIVNYDRPELGLHDKPTAQIDNAAALVGIYYFADITRLRNFRSSYDRIGMEISKMVRSCGANKKLLNLPNWHDIGQLSTYYNTQANLINSKSRSFNTISVNVDLNILSKSSTDLDILIPEINWYKNLSSIQKRFVPEIIESDDNNFMMNFEPGILLSDMMIYDDLTKNTWSYILDKIFKVMNVFWESKRNILSDDIWMSSIKMYIDKTNKRIDDMPNDINVLFEQNGVFDKLRSISKKMVHQSKYSSTIHGDLHFGNIIWQSDRGTLKLIDPRGSWGDDVTSSGDMFYDYYKLAHDIILDYNYILADMPVNENAKYVKKIFKDHVINLFGENTYNLIVKGGILLMATCIPLHADDNKRQFRFAHRVIQELENLERE